MFISHVKAKGNIYFYVYVYDNQSMNGLRTIYSFGRKEKVLEQLTNWVDPSKIPIELVNLGLKREKVEEWEKKVKRLENI